MELSPRYIKFQKKKKNSQVLNNVYKYIHICVEKDKEDIYVHIYLYIYK